MSEMMADNSANAQSPNEPYTVDVNTINQMVIDSDSADKDLQAEQRSNVLLFSGEHYSKRVNSFISQVRASPTYTQEQKIRLTKNHIQRIAKGYINVVTSYAPSARAFPADEASIQSVKAADLNNAVIQFLQKKHELKRKIKLYAQDFFVGGEVGVVALWNPNKGKLLGYKPVIDPESGEMVTDEWGRPQPSETPVFSGDMEIKRFFPWTVIRPKDCQNVDDADFWGFKELVDIKELKAEYKGDEDKSKFINAAGTTSKFVVFNPGNGSYTTARDCAEIRNVFWKPSILRPQGWYSISTNLGILEEGPLPFGIYPVIVEPCDEFESSCRGRSPIKVWRPYQAEINRASSKMAEHQITLGDDKLIFTNGSKVTEGLKLPGIRTAYTTGAAPTVIGGRTGEQYMNYLSAQVEELYGVAMVSDLLSDKTSAQSDPYAVLFANLRQRKQFSHYNDKFERFVVRLYTLLLELARNYLSDDEIVTAVGKCERINMQEFREASSLHYDIKVEPMSDDVDTVMGKQLVFNHLIQFVGPQLSRSDLGKLIAEMPLISEGKRIFSDLVINEDNATNAVLQLDRGQVPPGIQNMDKDYLVQRLTARQMKPDFAYLPPQIQSLYAQVVQEIQAAKAEDLKNVKAMEADMIPAQGFLTPCDFYVPDPADPSKTRRARLPIDALSWLVQRLEKQGIALEQLEATSESNQAGVAQQYMNSSQGAAAEGQAGEVTGQGRPMNPNAQGGAQNVDSSNAGSSSLRI